MALYKLCYMYVNIYALIYAFLLLLQLFYVGLG